MKAEAFTGLAGQVVEFLLPETEADAAGLLLTFLCAFGCAVGPGPHAIADGTKHPARLNVVLVGRSSRARKGTSWAVVRRLFDQADAYFSQERVIGGLTSGEGLVAALDRRAPGLDRSVLVHEPEFARLLRVAAMSATLSAIVREAWDGGDLSILTKKSPTTVYGANVAVLGHVTSDELRRRLDSTEASNGFGNRFIYIWVERSKRLPSGGTIPLDGLEALGVEVHDAIERARCIGVLERSPEAEALWAEIYCGLDDELDGVVGALSARAEAQMLRTSVAYALLDGSEFIEVEHVEAAAAVWEACEQTIGRVFAGTQPDRVIGRLLAALHDAGAEGLDGSEQRDLFSRHLAGSRLASARWELERRGLAHTVRIETGGRPRVVTRLVAFGTAERLSSLPSPPRSPFGRFEEPENLGSENEGLPTVRRES